MNMKAMVLAAGKATRLRPLTERIAKPALSFFGRSILDRVLDGLAAAGASEAVVNLHHAPETVRAIVERRAGAPPRVTYSDETRELLGTGGALVPVRERFEAEPAFLLVNGDCVHELDIGAVLDRHRASGADCTLAVRPRSEPGFGALRVDGAGDVTAWSVPAEGRPDERHFLSVQVVSPRVLQHLPAGGAFPSFSAWYPRAQAAGCRFTVFETDAEWHALDSRELYLDACADWLRRRALESWIAPEAVIESGAVVGAGCAIHAGARIESGARVTRSALLEGAVVSSGATVEDAIVGPGGHVERGANIRARLIAR